MPICARFVEQWFCFALIFTSFFSYSEHNFAFVPFRRCFVWFAGFFFGIWTCKWHWYVTVISLKFEHTFERLVLFTDKKRSLEEEEGGERKKLKVILQIYAMWKANATDRPNDCIRPPTPRRMTLSHTFCLTHGNTVNLRRWWLHYTLYNVHANEYIYSINKVVWFLLLLLLRAYLSSTRTRRARRMLEAKSSCFVCAWLKCSSTRYERNLCDTQNKRKNLLMPRSTITCALTRSLVHSIVHSPIYCKLFNCDRFSTVAIFVRIIMNKYVRILRREIIKRN